MSAFWIEITTGMVVLTKDEIWPDGDAPKKPSAMHVKAKIEDSGPLWKVMHEWNLDDDLNLEVGEIVNSTHGMCECSDCSPKIWKGQP